MLEDNHRRYDLTDSSLAHDPVGDIEANSGATPSGARTNADNVNRIPQEALQERNRLVKRKRRENGNEERIQNGTAAPNLIRGRSFPCFQARSGSTPQNAIVIEDCASEGTHRILTPTPIQREQSAASRSGAQADQQCEVCLDTFTNLDNRLRRASHSNGECQGVVCVNCRNNYVKSVDVERCDPLECMFSHCPDTLNSDGIRKLVSKGASDE